jgi:hypothetical protein
MIQGPLFYLVIASAIGVLIILLIGISSFARGGEFNRKHANRIMRYRIAAQALAVILVLLFVFIKNIGN